MASRKKGLLITFEGGDGAGKSTQIRRLARWLKREGLDVLVTRQPGGSSLGRRLRRLILNPGHRVCQQAELLMYEADRAQHVEEILAPALAQGKVVVSDRFSDSSTVYQGMCRGLGVDWTESINRFATRGLEPDLTVVLDVSETVGRGRLHQTRRRLDRIEREASAFHRKVRRSFLELARRHPERMVVLDGSLPKEAIAASIRELVLCLVSGDVDREGILVRGAEGSKKHWRRPHRAAEAVFRSCTKPRAKSTRERRQSGRDRALKRE